MAQIFGTNIADTVVMFDDRETFATHLAKYGQGGLRTVQTFVERNNISVNRREAGMLVWVKDTSTFYRLKNTYGTGQLTDNDWVECLIASDEIILNGVTGTQTLSSIKTLTYSKITWDIIIQNVTQDTLHTTITAGCNRKGNSVATNIDFRQGSTLVIGTEPNNIFNVSLSGIGSAQMLNLSITTTDTLDILVKISDKVGSL